jgi:hypothetical protein
LRCFGSFVWQAIVPAGGLSGRRRTDHLLRRYFYSFAFRSHSAAKPEKFVAYRKGGLKGRLQA